MPRLILVIEDDAPLLQALGTDLLKQATDQSFISLRVHSIT